MCNRDKMCLSARIPPFINLSSIKDRSFDNILQSKIQMTKELGGVILTSSLKIPEMTSSKTRQTLAGDKKLAVSGAWSEWSME